MTEEKLSAVAFPSIINDRRITKETRLKDLYEAKKNELGLSDKRIQTMLGMDSNTIKPILEGTARQINFINLIKLANFLGLTFNQIISIYVPQMNSKQIGEIQRARDAGYIAENFDVKTLTSVGFFGKHASGKELAERIRIFFGFNSLYDYTNSRFSPAFSRTKRSSSENMRVFWATSAYYRFKEINNPNPYDRKRLMELVPSIKHNTRNVEKGLITVSRALYKVGVTVIYQPKLEKEQVRGATMAVNDKPCIVLSNLNNQYPTIWFSLMHELYHVMIDFEEIKKRVFHITDSSLGDIFLINEEKADRFAQDYLFNDDRMRYISGFIDSEPLVNSFAEQCNIHPSIIYAFYCYQHERAWALYRKHIPTMDKAIELINVDPFEKETLVESVEQLKNILTL